MPKKKKLLGEYPFIIALISDWKPRAKKLKIKLKKLAAEADIAPEHLSTIIKKKTKNPNVQIINDIEMALRAAENKRG